MKVLFTIFLVLIIGAGHFHVFGQANFATNGNWNVASNWDASNIGDGAEDVTTNNNRSPIIVSGDNYAIGNMSAGGNLTINSGGTLTLGTSVLFDGGTDKSLTFLNNSTLTVAGNLEIWGDLIVSNSLTLNLTGSMIVHGDISMANGGSLTVSGSGTLTVGGNLTGGNNTQITTSGDGTIAVTGAIAIGGGTSSITGPVGSITAGSCTCGACGGSCPNTVLPVKLYYFDVLVKDTAIELKWATSMEVDFSKFIIQRASDPLKFEDIGEVPGQGRDIYNVITRYSFEDRAPLLGYNYYRLKALDIDNSYEYFNVKAAKLSGKKALTVFPNPSNGEVITFATNFNPSEGDRIMIVTAFGKELHNIPASGGYTTYKPSQQLAPGIYFIRYSGLEFQESVRLVIK